MTDPFEVRMRFTNQLSHLSASALSSQRAASYALKYRDLDEDLHSCILESLERVTLNTRANIMFFIEHLAEASMREAHPGFVRMMRRDIVRIIDLVAPDDGSGAANVKVVRRVLGGLVEKGVLDQTTFAELEECLSDRDQKEMDEHEDQNGHDDGSAAVRRPFVATATATAAPAMVDMASAGRSRVLDKRQIEQRIEEDRERHKRARESVWAVDPSADPAGELERVWDETSDVDDDDYVVCREQMEERRGRAELHRLEVLA